MTYLMSYRATSGELAIRPGRGPLIQPTPGPPTDTLVVVVVVGCYVCSSSTVELLKEALEQEDVI